jgi:hypothetical protein
VVSLSRKDIISILVAFYFLFLMFYGSRAWFYPSTSIAFVMYAFVQIGMIYLAIFMYKSPIKPTKTKYGEVKKPIVILGIIFIMPAMFWLPISVGIPAQISLLLSPNEKIITTVSSVDDRSRGCHNKISFTGMDIFLKFGICVSKDVVGSYRKGDKVELIVNKSILGIRIYSFKKYG